ncbi:caspase-7-like [Haliotis rufescens]|uniref:caspase-7-like n=1 Tax=Haliotis rufescens TaxID=6454 RepID=UPI00201E7581|nr:caspase-7-like [Haliotis rufescens]XP_046376744.2 caspase-7-like [Haliotis rufescens]
MAESDLAPSQRRGKVTIVRCDMSNVPDEYTMSHRHRGIAVVINNRDFTTLGVGCRGGTDQDGKAVSERWEGLGFDVRMHINQTKRQMQEMMIQASKEDHSDSDCFVCVILSHGEEDRIYGTDGPVEVTKLLDPFKGHRCPTLAGKPKLFFIQACRGKATDFGADVTDAMNVVGDGEDEDGDDAEEPVTYRIPTEADFLIAYSVVSGYYSWRDNMQGSLFIQALCEVLKEHGATLDLMTLMTRVNKMVAYGFEVQEIKDVKRPYVYKMKQIPSVLSMLTKDVYFRPKQ